MSWGSSNKQWSPRHLNSTCLPNPSPPEDPYSSKKTLVSKQINRLPNRKRDDQHQIILSSSLALNTFWSWQVLSYFVEKLFRASFQRGKVATAPGSDPRKSQRGKHRIFPRLNREQGVERCSGRKSHRQFSKNPLGTTFSSPSILSRWPAAAALVTSALSQQERTCECRQVTGGVQTLP